MSHLIDMSAWNNPRGQTGAAAREVELSYVLVADAHLERAAACLESIKPFNVGVLVARDGEEAIRVVERFGPPLLLIVDLSICRKDGFAVIEALRSVDGSRSEIIAWSSFRELREFAAHRLAGLNVRVLGGAVAPAVLRGAIERALRNRAAAPPSSSGPSPRPSAEDVYQTMAELSEKARRLCGTAGVAVYLRAPGDTQFRASVTWTSDTPVPHSPYYMPRVFGWILETGEALVLPDLATQPLSDVPTSTLQDVVRGLVAVPIVSTDQQIVGTICVFDLTPLTLGGAEVDALKALGRGVSVGSAATSVRPEADLAGDEPRPGPAPVVSDADDRPQPPLLDLSTVEALGRLISEGPAATPVHPGPGKEPLSEEAPEVGHPDAARESPPVDSFTALLDRRGGDFAIARELARARREERQLSVILFDVGPPSRTNEGAAMAPPHDLLGVVGETLTKAIRGSDLAIRWSSDELLVVLPGLSVTEARPVAERVRAAMQAGARHRVAVCGGVADLLAGDTFESVVARANEKVRLARERGHNRVA